MNERAIEVRQTPPSAPQLSPSSTSQHVRILLHRNTYSAEEQSRRVAEVINKLRAEGATNVSLYIGADPDTPHEAIDRLLDQLRASGYLKTQVHFNQ